MEKMHSYPQTVIWRHRRENLKKCSLRGLELRSDCSFLTYPHDALPDLNGYICLSLGAPPLTEADGNRGLFLIDATWRLAHVMSKQIPVGTSLVLRSVPDHFRTAYPRRQEDCIDPERGLASIEALYIAYRLMGRDPDGLLDNYYWKDSFLKRNFDI